MENPYIPVLEWIRVHPDTGSARRLAKLILSMWSTDAAFSLKECVRGLDREKMYWARRMTAHYLRHGVDRYLNLAGMEVKKMYPSLWRIGYISASAKIEAVKETISFLEN